ncbi:MAG TPA: nucleotide sugar dehydrogenase [Candidatus Acidoferrum sp.]|nr:nucleotide sugar dehydrogenase [Candidatus Acidoferrum sp.]
MPSSISVFGLGYVGAVTSVCLAHKGNRVVGVDLNPFKVSQLKSGRTPIVEARVEEMAAEANRAQLLDATTEVHAAISNTNLSFICVGTPSRQNGKLDLSGVERVCAQIGAALKQKNSFHLIALRSTVLPGTTEQVVIPALEEASGKKAGTGFDVCFHPEFLREGTAVSDFFNPPFTVLGCNNREHLAPLRELYHWVSTKIYETAPGSAEMVKYVCNAFHGLKVSFANEVGTLCKAMGVDTEAVSQIFASDTQLNISPAYLKPGFAFGGSCLPKDLRGITYRAKELDLRLPLFESIMPSNTEHLDRAAEAILRKGKKKIGLLGLSFKPGTDDLRESSLVRLVKRMLGEGCQCKIYDQDVVLGRILGSNRDFIEDTIPHIGSLLTQKAEEVIEFADVLIIGTKSIAAEKILKHLRPQTFVFDLVHLEKDHRLMGHGAYEGICWN